MPESPVSPEPFASGRCACGEVRYRLTTSPMFVHACHCRDCQRQSGGPFAINALIEADRMVVEGVAPVATTMPTDSGRPHDIWRCPLCQTALWSDYGRREVMRFVRVTTLEAPQLAPPDVHIFTRSKLPWFDLPAGVRSFEVYYDTAAEWPAQSLARRIAALGRV